MKHILEMLDIYAHCRYINPQMSSLFKFLLLLLANEKDTNSLLIDFSAREERK
jgi:hypothetical protein